jgi:uncharacterized protein YbjT (DUF2867 family)
MPNARILVTGANGRTGRAVVSALNELGLQVCAFIRKSQQETELKAIGAAECAIGDMKDTNSIEAAVSDCDKIVHIGPPMHPNEVEMTKNFIQAAAEAKIGHFVYYSVMHPLRRDVRHHRLKLDAEEVLIESGLPYTILQPMRYMQHLEGIWTKVKDSGVHAMPFNTDVRFNVVDLLDLAHATAIVCAEDGHHYATYELAGPEALNQRDMAEILSQELYRPVEAKAMSIERLKENARSKQLSDERIEQMTIMNQHYDQHGFLGNPNVLTFLIKKKPTTFRQYVQRLIKQGEAQA